MFIPIVTDPSNNPDRNTIHGTSCFHFQADYVVFVSQLIPFLSVLHQLLSRSYRPIPYSSAFGVWPPFSFHKMPDPVIKLIKSILLLPGISERAGTVFFVFHLLVIRQEELCIVRCTELDAPDRRPNNSLCICQHVSVVQ